MKTDTLPRWRFAMFFVPLAFYTLTAARVPGWLDATLITSIVGQLNLSSWVNNHNLFTVIGHLVVAIAGRNNPHYALVLLCSFFGALTVYLIFLAGLEIARPVSAVLGALALMVSHSLWWHSTMVEVYTLNSAIIASVVLSLLRYRRTSAARYLYAAFFLWGLGCSNHVLMGLFLPAFIVLLVMLRIRGRTESWRTDVLAAASFLVGISLFLGLFVRDVAAAFRPVSGLTDTARALFEAFGSILDRATGGHFKGHMFTSNMTPAQTRFWRLNYLFLLFANFPSIALPLGFAGAWAGWKRDTQKWIFVFVALALAAQIIWSANYFIWDMYAFALPVYVLFAVPVIVGIDWAIGRSRLTRIAVICLAPTLLLPLVLYPSAERWYENDGFITRYFNNYEKLRWTEPTWHAAGYIANPNKRNYTMTKQVAEKLFEVLPPESAVLTSESRLDYPMRLYYQRTLGIRPDIRYIPFFGMGLTEATIATTAARLSRAIEGTAPTYVSSLGPPDRLILNELWLRYDPEADPDYVAGLSEEEFVALFPRITFERVDLLPEEEVWIYRVGRRPEV